MVETAARTSGGGGGGRAAARSRKRSAATPPPPAAAAASDVAPKKPEAALVFLRVKRRRTDTPVERLVVHRDEPLAAEKSEAAGDKPASQKDLLSAFTKLSTKEKSSFVFKHIDTMENPLTTGSTQSKWTERLKKKARSLKDEHTELRTRRSSSAATPFQKTPLAPTSSRQTTEARALKQQDRARERRRSEIQRSRGLEESVIEIKEKGTVELPGIRLVDLQAVRVTKENGEDGKATGDESTAKSSAAAESSEALTVNGARLRPTRVLNPGERELDESIWMAFQHNDFSQFFAILNSQRPEIRANPATFQRPADGGSALMAAAHHGRADVIEKLLQHSPTCVMLQDWEGAMASVFARRNGHSSVEKALVACEDAERDKDFVYDVYCVDVSQESSAGATDSEMSDEDGASTVGPVVTVSPAVQLWLSQDGGGHDEPVEEYMLESDPGSHEGSDAESVDSNDEDFFANDYPDEESSGEESDDWDEVGGRRRPNAADEYSELDEDDY